MTPWANEIGAFVVVLAILAGLLLALGTIRSTKPREQSIFVAGWGLVLFSSLILVANY